MIPKIIHYCWFGPKQIPNDCQKLINDWKIYCPDWEFQLWNEDSFDITSHSFTHSAYEAKKYAFVTDYVRAWALNKFGGVYLDTDVELKAPLDTFLKSQAFTGFETKGYPFTALWGSEPNHKLTQQVLSYYDDRIYHVNNETNTTSVSQILITEFGIDPQIDCYQLGKSGSHTIDIYPSTHFCLDLPPNFATHHFYGSWLENQQKTAKQYLNEQYQINQMIPHSNFINSKNYLRALAKNLTFKSFFFLIRQFLKR